MKRIVVTLIALVLVLFTAHAHADLAPCDFDVKNGLANGPIVVGLYAADLGAGRRACPRSEFSLAARGAVAIDLPKFYGNIAIGTLLSISYSLKDRAEIFGTVELLDWEYAQNATLKGAEARFGQTTLGVMVPVWKHSRAILSVYAKAMLPTAGPSRTLTFGEETGLTFDYRARKWLSVHGFAGYDSTMGVSAAPSVSRHGGALTAGVQFLPKRWFAVAVDFATHYGSRAAVDYLAPSLALRFRAWRSLGIELSGLVNVFGSERKDAAATLRVAWRY